MESRKDLIRYRLARARETLEDAHILAEVKHWNACVNRLYYACFYAVSALLMQRGLSSSKHTGGCGASLIIIMSRQGRFLRNWLRFTMIFLNGVRKVITWILSILMKLRFVVGFPKPRYSWSRLLILLIRINRN